MSEIFAAAAEKESNNDELSREQRQELRLEAIIGHAMSGALSDPSVRRSYDTQKLSPRALKVVQLRAAGMKIKDIAEVMCMSGSYVTRILTQEGSKVVLAALLGYASNEIVDVRTRLRSVASEMLEEIIDTTRNTRDPKLRSKNAFQLLALAGYGAVEEKKITVETRVEGPQAKQLFEAINEAMQLEDGEIVPNYSVLASEVVEQETTSDLEDGPQLRLEPGDEAVA
jgi:DNA-binding CsgD family transcriptional regulator/phosphotransferase system HPr-like phosphotransfer protein